MGTRFRVQNNDWDPMREDYENSSYTNQYADEDAGGEPELDHCRLYVRNIPPTMNEEGFRNIFSRFGTIVEIFVNAVPANKYGLVLYETPGEAKLAMMKLNKMEPLRLNINIAHKKKSTGNQYQKRGNSKQNDKQVAKERGHPRDSFNYSSRGHDDIARSVEDCVLHDDISEHLNDSYKEDSLLDLSQINDMYPDVNMELECLKLESLAVKEKQIEIKSRILKKLAAEGKSHLANGDSHGTRWAVTTNTITANRSVKALPPTVSDQGTAVVAGSSLLPLPSLQRESSRECVACGAVANTFCGGCAVTPYCSQGCQRRDWNERHSSVCHNLARSGFSSSSRAVPTALVAAPMRPLRSPNIINKRDDENNTERAKKFSQNNNSDTRSNQNNFKKSPGSRPWIKNRNQQSEGSVGRKNVDKRPANEDTAQRANKRNDVAPSTSEAPKQPLFKQSEPIVAISHKPNQKNTPITKMDNQKSPLKENTTPKRPVLDSVADVTPSSSAQSKLVPASYLIETLSTGAMCLLSVDKPASECLVDGGGFVCLSMTEASQLIYHTLCSDYVEHCAADNEAYTPTPGELFSYYNEEDSGWYRARCLNRSQAALLDITRLVPLTGSANCRKLTDPYRDIPEFCCLLRADVKLGANLKCTLLSNTPNGYKVSLEDVESGDQVIEGHVSRWMPKVDYCATSQSVPIIPKVPRPDVANNSLVTLIDATDCERVFVRPHNKDAQVGFDSVLFDVLVYGKTATPLTQPPAKGQTVVAKFTDNFHYRALVTRINVTRNKYLLEYIEYGNMHIAKLEDLYHCPEHLDLKSRPTLASQVTIKFENKTEFTEPALKYIEDLKDGELSLTIPSGAETAPSGSEVNLTIVKTNESFNKKLEEMCTPDWKKIEKRGGDVVESKVIMYQDLKYLTLPLNGCEVLILDISGLEEGSVSGTLHAHSHSHVDFVLNVLPHKLAAYCDSEVGRDPYLPRYEELCVAQALPDPHWYRAVLCEQSGGAGGSTASVMFIDYGNIEKVPVTSIRKMLPEFVDGLPAIVFHLEIRGFPKYPTKEQLVRAVEFMNIDDEGRGTLRLTKCEEQLTASYVVDAPELLAAIGS